MSTNSESSFGARLKNANDLTSYIAGFPGYNPPRNEETPGALKELTGTIEQLNAEAAAKKSVYKTETALRQQLFKGGNTSLEKLLSPVSKAVAAQYGKNSDESKQVSSLIRRMRATKLEIPPAMEGGNGETEEKNSRSQRSFGSMAQHFKDLVSVLAGFNGYVTSNNGITLETLTQLSEKMNASNHAVATAFQQMRDVMKQRQAAYADLAERAGRVKLYVASQYGNNSNEYKMISRLKI